MSVPQPYRPGILNLVTIVSFVLSGLNVLWLIVISVLVLIAGALTWLGGPIVGALTGLAGTLIPAWTACRVQVSAVFARAE